MKERYDELIKLIEKANYDYYTLDNPTVTDREYDNWMSELLDIEERHPEIKRKDSPSEKIGGEVISEFKKVEHKIGLFSISDVFNFLIQVMFVNLKLMDLRYHFNMKREYLKELQHVEMD